MTETNFSTKIKSRRFPVLFLIVLTLMLMYISTSFAGETNKARPVKVKMSADKRFIDNGDKTITDTKTGLMWMKEDSWQQTGHWLDWFGAFDFVKKSNEEKFANYRDWEVPTVDELKTLYEPEKFNSAQLGSEMTIHIDPIFAKEGSGSHWSIQENGHFNAFGVVLNHGGRFSLAKKSKARKSVRAVRHLKP